MKTLFWDLETSPHEVYEWSLFSKNPIPLQRLIAAGGVICGGTMWMGQKRATFRSMWDDDLLQHLWEKLDEADAVVSWNGERFDTRQMNRMFMLAKIPPPSPYKEIDLMKVSRKQFDMPSHKLEHVADALGVGRKLSGEMKFQDWIDFIDGGEKARRKMKRYALRDVELLEPIYERFLPWATKHPNVNLYNDTQGCPRCGSTSYQKRGFKYTAVSTYQQYRCNDCASWFNDGVRQAGATFRSAA